MAFEHYIRSGQKLLRCGYTTGTCAALAAAGATRLLLTGNAPETVSLRTPRGLVVEVSLHQPQRNGDTARCAVLKDGGDDIDATHGLPIFALVRRIPEGICIDGGEGVGRVTRPGLDQPVGAAAINRVPREMIENAVRDACDALGYDGGIAVTVSAPGGEQVAKKTFNPMLGIEGGISVLGTSGIVEPMSEQALIDTIAVEIRQAAAVGARNIVLTPGNYGQDFIKSSGMELGTTPCVKYSNFVGDALDIAATEGFQSVLLVGHLGKLVKVAGGMMNTHSRWGDCRRELICAHAAAYGADREVCRALMKAATTDACIAVLDGAGLREPVMDALLEAIQLHLERRAADAYQVGAVVFSNEYGLLGQTKTVKGIMKGWT